MKPMLRRMWGAAVLHADTYEEVEADPSSITQATLIVIGSSLAIGVASLIQGSQLDMPSGRLVFQVALSMLLPLLVWVLETVAHAAYGAVLAGITYIVWRFYERLRMYSVVQQASVVFVLLLASEAVRMVVRDLAWDRGWTWGIAVPALTSTLLWPIVYRVLQRFRLQFRVE
ncbi:MAG: hypothetical protein IIA30_14735 [Myxococcales bacterium]|nr:hypothetical protein [Myxococcales bacterium]